jgi:hypothetical protein
MWYVGARRDLNKIRSQMGRKVDLGYVESSDDPDDGAMDEADGDGDAIDEDG